MNRQALTHLMGFPLAVHPFLARSTGVEREVCKIVYFPDASCFILFLFLLLPPHPPRLPPLPILLPLRYPE